MINPAAHPSSFELEGFVAGRLTAAEAEAVIVHLAECDPCLSAADELWTGATDLPIPAMDPELARRVERRLRRRIHSAALGGQAVRLSTHGLLNVLLALLRPLFYKR